jgi:DNA polymerase (family 10)
MRSAAVLEALEELIVRLELREPQSFRIQAYKKLWDTLSRLPETAWASAEALIRALHGQPGIGEGLLNTAVGLYENGTVPLLEELRAEVPDSLLELRRLPGLGPKRIHQLWKEARITSIDALDQAIARGKLQNLAGWGPALLKKVEESIQFYRSTAHQWLLQEAQALWIEAVHALRERGIMVVPLGALRRAWPLLSHIEGALPASQKDHAREAGWQLIESTRLKHSDFPIELHLIPDKHWVETLALEGFSEENRQKLQRLFSQVKEIPATEEALFFRAGLPYILPAWRDWPDIVDLALAGKLPEPLTEAHVRGSVHVHTTYSDGRDSLEAMATAAQQMGWKWLGIADHSERAAYAGGLSPERLAQQGEEIARLNASYKGTFLLLRGIEADILPDGRVDYEEAIWRRLDFIVASVHEKLRMSREEATQRLLTALGNPYVRVLGHWTGRLLRARPGYPIEEERILKVCAERGIAIEFNANPYRMEIDWRWVRRAAELGVRVILTTDAHSVQELSYWKNGLAVLQKGLLPPDLLLNAAAFPPFPLNS